MSHLKTGMMSAAFQMAGTVLCVRLRLNSVVRDQERDVAVSCKQAVLILLGPDDLCGLSLGIICNTFSLVLGVRSGRKLRDNAVASKEDS